MRTNETTDGAQHPPDAALHDHHAAPDDVDFSNTTQGLAAGATYDLDVALPRSDYTMARVLLQGRHPAIGLGVWKERCSLVVTTDSTEAIGHSARDASSKRSQYHATYSKQNSDSQLSHKIFDNATAYASRYISLQDAWITGSVLRLRFKNHRAAVAVLWVKGRALLF